MARKGTPCSCRETSIGNNLPYCNYKTTVLYPLLTVSNTVFNYSQEKCMPLFLLPAQPH